MNLRRGVLRLWLVLSLCWIVGVGVFAWGYEPWSAGRSGAARPGFRLVPPSHRVQVECPATLRQDARQHQLSGSLSCAGVIC
jgi:hypothetical protein